MKKIVVVFMFLISCFSLIACNKSFKFIKSSIAEIRYNIFKGSSENFDITFMSGKREKDYVINGYNTDLIDFGVVTISLKNQDIDTTNSTFALTIDTLRYEDNLEKNPFDGTLVADIGVIVDNSTSSISIKVFIDKIVEEIELKNLSSNWEIDSDKALKIACSEINEQLKPLTQNEFLGEVYIKIIEDTIVDNGNYYWYVNFVTRTGTTHNILIDPKNGDILAKKI